MGDAGSEGGGMSAQPLLQIVDPDTGELRAPGCESCADLAAKLAGAEGDLHVLTKENTKLLRRIDALQRDRDAERLNDPRRSEILSVFAYWQERCRHPNARFDGARHDLIKARLRQFTADELRTAIDGASVAAYVDSKGKRHDRLGLILENAERVEDFCNRYHRWQKRQAN
jgi:hypothetical protein